MPSPIHAYNELHTASKSIAAHNSIPPFQSYNFKTMMQPSEPSINGGHYTGAPFKEGAEYRDFPVKADALHFDGQIETPDAKLQRFDERMGNNQHNLLADAHSVNGVKCHKKEKVENDICSFIGFKTDSFAKW